MLIFHCSLTWFCESEVLSYPIKSYILLSFFFSFFEFFVDIITHLHIYLLRYFCLGQSILSIYHFISLFFIKILILEYYTFLNVRSISIRLYFDKVAIAYNKFLIWWINNWMKDDQIPSRAGEKIFIKNIKKCRIKGCRNTKSSLKRYVNWGQKIYNNSPLKHKDE